MEEHEEKLSGRIRNLLLGRYYLRHLPRILAGDVDADRCDFIRRDTHQTGVAYGRYDLDWLISTCTLGKNSKGDFFVGFDERKAVRVVEQFLIARRALYDTVYHHKTVRCAEGMMALFLRRLKEVILEGTKFPVADFVQPLITMMEGKPLPPQDLLRLNDFSLSVLVEIVAHSDSKDIKDTTVRDLAQRIQARELFKQVKVSSDVLDDYIRDNGRDPLHEIIKTHCHPGEPKDYLVIDNADFMMMSEKENEQVYLVGEDGLAIPAREHNAFNGYRDSKRKETRLFTISEAVRSVERCITGS